MKLLRYNIIFLNILIFFVPAVFLADAVNVDKKESFTIFQDFKAVLMYFSETFLKGATFGNKTLEGEMPLLMPEKLIHILDSLESEYSDVCKQDSNAERTKVECTKIEQLTTFRKQLEAGYNVAVKLSEIPNRISQIQNQTSRYEPRRKITIADVVKISKEVQSFAISSFNDGNKNTIVIPSGWVGHATVLVIKKSAEKGDGFYDLAYINTGQGLQHHYYQPDPNSVYPYLTRLWLEFKNIPSDLIFDPETSWLFYALYSIGSKEFADKLEESLNDKKESCSNYLYGTLLANFDEFLVEPEGDGITEKLFPEQQSGSCTMSSLLGALLYFSESIEDFYWYRLKIGHVLLESFLTRLKRILTEEISDKNELDQKKIRLFKGKLTQSDDDFEFVSVLKDAFLSGGAKLFYGLVRALANLQLQYFEHKFPGEFKHAGLIGSERSKWVTEKKLAAIDKLKYDENAMHELKRTLQLAKLIHEEVLELKYRPETMHIQDLSEIHGYFSTESIYLERREDSTKSDAAIDQKFTINEGGNIYRNLVEGVPERLEVEAESHSIRTFDLFSRDFNELYERTDSGKVIYFMRFLDVFRRLRAGAGWSLIYNHQDKDELNRLQQTCKKLAYKYAELSNNNTNDVRKITMDEVTFLGHIQLLSWHLFRALHNLYSPTNRIKWEELNPPSTVQRIMLDNVEGHISGALKKWPIKGFNDVENYRLYELFINESRSECRSSEQKYNSFPGPEELILKYGNINFSEYTIKEYLNAPNLKAILREFINIPAVQAVWYELRALSEHKDEWKKLDVDYAKFLIVLTGRDNLYQIFPHYYNLMYTLHCIRLGTASYGIYGTEEKFWLHPAKNPEWIYFMVGPLKVTEFNSLFERNYPLSVFQMNISVSELFYVLRHSYALPVKVEMTDVDTWFNYVKNAKTSKIFDNSYFQYTTDHLLNIPKYQQEKNNSTLLFNNQMARKIILQLIKLINFTLEELFDESGKVTLLRREQIIRRCVNMAVITTRFISRADYEFKDSADTDEWALLLAKLYNIIEPFSFLNSPVLKLNDPQVSMINFALSHMCYTHLSKPDIFCEAINLRFDYRYKRHRRTLARVHWFIAKINYTISANETIADDQFKYGFSGSKLEQDEVRFFEVVLERKFLNHYFKIESEYSYRYDIGGYVVEISNSTHESVRLLINLATGSIIERNLMVSSKSSFINSNEFQAYFSSQDQKYLATVGKAYVIYGLPVFTLPTFKGSDYFMFQYLNNIWLLRKWNENWYIWRPIEKFASFFEALDYSWKENPIKTFMKNKSTFQDVEMIIFDEGGSDPIFKISKMRKKPDSSRNHFNNYLLSVPGLTDEISAKIIDKEEYREMHLRKFAEEGIAYSKQESDRTVMVIYNNHRLLDDPLKPFVITAASDNKLLVRNVSEMEICKDQRIGKEAFGVPGCLVASFGGKKILLAPLAEVQKRSNIPVPTPRPYITIEKIPMVEKSISVPGAEGEKTVINTPAPQSRLHKLLLAYYMILAQNFDSARKLLHPSTSIHHNSMFSKEELQIISWILRIDMESPEFSALALITVSHFLINDAKFSFGYTEEVSKAAEEISKNPLKIFYSYMMSIRELPEKYYIFKIFPEILVENSVLSNVFFGQNGFSGIHFEKQSEKFSFPSYFPQNPYASEFEFGQRQGFIDFLRIFDDMFSHSGASRFNLETKLMKYLIVRNRSSEKFDNGFEMAIYCCITDGNSWNNSKRKLNSGRYWSEQSRVDEHVKTEFKRLIEACNKSKKFDGISLAKLSKPTDFKDIQATMRSDLGLFEDSNSEISDHSITIETEEEKTKLVQFKNDLMKLIMATGNYTTHDLDLGFDLTLVESSKVLGSLYKSIDSFITEKGRNHSTSFDLKSNDTLFTELNELNTLIVDRISSLESEQNILAEQLIEETYPEAEDFEKHPHMIENLFAMMHKRKQKNFSDLYACYLKDSLTCIQRKFPQLDEDQCEIVKKDSVLFFSQSILLDYLKMLLKSANTFIESGSVPVDDLMIFCNELEKISDFNERIKNPIIMNFEFRSKKYRLKTEQVKDIELLTSINEESDNFKSVVIQRMMAAGKTLVLGTISVVMKALKRNDRLSILVPPSALFQSNTTAMQTRTYEYFKKNGNNFNFPRLPLPTDKEIGKKISDFLGNVIGIINHTMESRNYLILSPDYLQTFLNSYIEAIESAKALCINMDPVYIGILKQYATIYQIFKEKSSIILDEIDMTMDPKKELNFPTIDTETYNMTAVAMLADIVEFMLFSREIKDAGLNIYSNNQAAMTPENYITCRGLVLDYIESQLQNESSLWRKFVPKPATEKVMNFFRSERISDKKKKAWVQKLSRNKSYAGLANALVIVKTQIYMHFEEFLGSTVNQNYGNAGPLRPNIKYAVPYVAANTPSAGSVFADRWETLIKTILMVSASPCSIETAKEVTEYIRKSIAFEAANDSELDLNSLPTVTNLSFILPESFNIMSLDEKDDAHVSMMYDALIPRSPAAIRVLYGYYINEVLSKMEFPVEQITSNALHMTSMFASVQGYSGTIDNVLPLPHQVIEEAVKDHDENEKNNGGISLKLIQDFDNEKIKELADESLSLSSIEMMEEFFKMFDKETINQISAIIDTGAFFKNFTNRVVAEAILNYFDGRMKVVLYYDEVSNQLEFIQGSYDEDQNLVSTTVGFLETTDPDDIKTKTQVTVDERFTFYDQRHITGSDILQPKFALAIMTAGPRVLLRDLLQGTLRMRQFMTSQKVHIVITESLRKFYNSKIKGNKTELHVSDVITLGSLNEDEKQIHENEKLAFGKIDAEIRAFVLDEISNKFLGEDFAKADFKWILNLFRRTRDLFIRSIRENPISWLQDRELQNTAMILEKHATHRLAKLRKFFISEEELTRLKALEEKLEKMYKTDYASRNDSLLKYLNEEISVRKNDTSGNEMVAQSQTQTLTLMDLDLDQFVEQIDTSLTVKGHRYNLIGNNINSMLKKENSPIPSNGYDYYSLKYIYGNQSPSEMEYVNSVLLTDGSNVCVTTDLLQLYVISNSSASQFPIFSRYNLEGTHLLVFTPSISLDSPGVILLSPRHASTVYEDLRTKTRTSYRFWLCDLWGEVKISNAPSEESVKNIFDLENLKPDLGRLIFDLLVFNGSFPQILANQTLRLIYETEWINGESFKVRAMFLRMRMKALAEKNSIMFEDDDKDYNMLIKYSSGNSRKDSNVEICANGYAKCAVTKEIQDEFNTNYSFSTVRVSATANDELYFNFDAIESKVEQIFDSFEKNGDTNVDIDKIIRLSIKNAQHEDAKQSQNIRKKIRFDDEDDSVSGTTTISTVAVEEDDFDSADENENETGDVTDKEDQLSDDEEVENKETGKNAEDAEAENVENGPNVEPNYVQDSDAVPVIEDQQLEKEEQESNSSVVNEEQNLNSANDLEEADKLTNEESDNEDSEGSESEKENESHQSNVDPPARISSSSDDIHQRRYSVGTDGAATATASASAGSSSFGRNPYSNGLGVRTAASSSLSEIPRSDSTLGLYDTTTNRNEYRSFRNSDFNATPAQIATTGSSYPSTLGRNDTSTIRNEYRSFRNSDFNATPAQTATTGSSYPSTLGRNDTYEYRSFRNPDFNGTPSQSGTTRSSYSSSFGRSTAQSNHFGMHRRSTTPSYSSNLGQTDLYARSDTPPPYSSNNRTSSNRNQYEHRSPNNFSSSTSSRSETPPRTENVRRSSPSVESSSAYTPNPNNSTNTRPTSPSKWDLSPTTFIIVFIIGIIIFAACMVIGVRSIIAQPPPPEDEPELATAA